jgi:hypothetical protein
VACAQICAYNQKSGVDYEWWWIVSDVDVKKRRELVTQKLQSKDGFNSEGRNDRRFHHLRSGCFVRKERTKQLLSHLSSSEGRTDDEIEIVLKSSRHSQKTRKRKYGRGTTNYDENIRFACHFALWYLGLSFS